MPVLRSSPYQIAGFGRRGQLPVLLKVVDGLQANTAARPVRHGVA
jgi:hypothetical protein